MEVIIFFFKSHMKVFSFTRVVYTALPPPLVIILHFPLVIIQHFNADRRGSLDNDFFYLENLVFINGFT